MSLTQPWRRTFAKWHTVETDALPSASDFPLDPDGVLDRIESDMKSVKAFGEKEKVIREILRVFVHIMQSLSNVVDPGMVSLLLPSLCVAVR